MPRTDGTIELHAQWLRDQEVTELFNASPLECGQIVEDNDVTHSKACPQVLHVFVNVFSRVAAKASLED